MSDRVTPMPTPGWNQPDSGHRLIIHELGRRWVDAMRGNALGTRFQIRHSAAVHDTLSIVDGVGRSTLVIEIGRDPIASLDVIERVRACGRETLIIAIARSDQRDLELPARELGAIAFLREPLTGRELARIVDSIAQLQVELDGRADG